MALASVNIRFGVDMREFQTKMQRATKKVRKFGKDMQQAGKTMTAAFSAPLALLGGRALQVFDQQVQAEMRLASALRATGQDAEAQMPKLKAFASEIQGVSTVGDEATLSMIAQATSMGLNADRAQTAAKQAIGLAAAFGMNEKSAIRYTAALQNGDTTMLNRYIPTLRSIEDESARVAKAQEMLNGMFDQAAVAAQDGLGPLTQLQNSLGDLLEQFGKIIADGIRPFVNRLKDTVRFLQSLDDQTKATIVKVAAFVAALGPLMTALGFMVSSLLPQMITGFKTLFSTGGLIAMGAVVVATLAKGFYDLNTTVNKTAEATEAMNDVRRRANRQVAGQVSRVEELVRVARTEETSMERRRKAVKTLQGISSKFNGVLEDEKINLDKLKTASDDYSKSLIKQARVKAARGKLKELQAELLDLQSGAEKVGTSFGENFALFTKAAFTGGDAATFLTDKTVEGAKNQEQAIAGVQAKVKALRDFIKDNKDLYDDLFGDGENTVSGSGGTPERIPAPKVEPPDTRGLKFFDGIKVPKLKIKEKLGFNQVESNPDPYKQWRNSLDKFSPIVNTVTQGFQGFFNTLLSGGVNPFQAVIDAIKQLVVRLLAAAAAAAVLAGIMTAIGIGPAAGGFGSGFSSIFGQMSGFGNIMGSAAGGGISGKEPRLVGEMGPEIFMPMGAGTIIPNNQLGSGGGVQRLHVTAGSFKLKGNSLQSGIDVSAKRKNRWR